MTDAVRAVVTKHECDLFVFSANIQGARPGNTADRFVDLVLRKKDRKKKASVFLTTYGGDPDGAFRMARALQRNYESVCVLVAGQCKSAGTLVAIGANEIAMGPTGEFGPLDVQMAKPDELMLSGSGLDIFTSLGILQAELYERFEHYLGRLTEDSGGTISTRTAADISVKLITGLMNPIAAHIDPMKLGEAQRAMNIVKAYAECLKPKILKDGALAKLVEEYPSHSFVIDRVQASELFNNVREFSPEEAKLAQICDGMVRYPDKKNQPIFDLGEVFGDHLPTEKKTDDSKVSSGGGANPPEGSGATATEGAPSASNGGNGKRVPANGAKKSRSSRDKIPT